MHAVSDTQMRAVTLEAAAAFGAPFNVVFSGVDEGATLTSSVERRGILSLGTELGGWGRVNVEGVRIGRRGLDNILKHFGVIDGNPDTRQRDGSPGTRHMMVPTPDYYIHSPGGGVFEPCHIAGETVREGEAAGFLHFVEDVDHPPVELRYRAGGVLWMSAGPGRVQRGDTVAVVMTDYVEGALG
jgi:N-alpha-acetyl-L-2,4-diaminobutyrate deacetylase